MNCPWFYCRDGFAYCDHFKNERDVCPYSYAKECEIYCKEKHIKVEKR